MMKVYTEKSRYFAIRRLHCYMMAAIVVFAGLSMAKTLKEPDKSASLILQSADNNENTYSNGEFISVLKGNVSFLYDDITIRSDEATWWRNQGIIAFRENIRVTRDASLLTCDKMEFTKNNNILSASGHFHFSDTLEKTDLMGDIAEYNLKTRFFQLRGKPKLVRYDTTTAETLTITSIKMIYVDSLKRATATDSVRIHKGKLLSKCRYAHYFTKENMAQLRVNPEVTYETHKIKGDSVDLIFGKETLRKALVVGNTYGLYADTLKGSRDTAFTQVWGDSLQMSISEKGNLDSLWAFGKAMSKYYVSNSADLVDEANGKRMLISFASDGNVRDFRIWGNAKSKYHIEENRSKGTNEASGDSITVVFKKGKAVSLALSGKARGMYYPRKL